MRLMCLKTACEKFIMFSAAAVCDDCGRLTLEKENIFHHIFLASPPTAGCRRRPSTFAPSTTIENNKRREAQQPRQGNSPRRSIITQHTQNVQRGALNVYEIEVDIAYQVIIIFSLLKMMSGEEARLNERETSGDAK